jgi:exodeoxyribonuclease V
VKWTAEQDAALKAVDRWMHTSEQIFRLFGFAGCGKTTILRQFAEHIDGEVLFVSFTGKAASVMRAKGCKGAKTIHSTIYLAPGALSPEGREIEAKLMELHRVNGNNNECLLLERKLREHQDKRRWTLRHELVPKPKLIICDEVSMVNRLLGTDLLSFGVKLLVVGDPFQLPPPRGAGFFTADKPDILLTNVIRQSRDSHVLRMATQVREHGAGSLRYDKFHFPIDALGEDELRAMCASADQILAGEHKTRKAYSESMRRAGGFSGKVPNVGEKLVCRKNNYSVGVLNGTLWQVLACIETDSDGYGPSEPVYRAKLLSLNDEEEPPTLDNVLIDRHSFAVDDEMLVRSREIIPFLSGFTVTVHSSQGSEWPNVVVIDDWLGDARNNFVYTALTRASKVATLVKVHDRRYRRGR